MEKFEKNHVKYIYPTILVKLVKLLGNQISFFLMENWALRYLFAFSITKQAIKNAA